MGKTFSYCPELAMEAIPRKASSHEVLDSRQLNVSVSYLGRDRVSAFDSTCCSHAVHLGWPFQFGCYECGDRCFAGRCQSVVPFQNLCSFVRWVRPSTGVELAQPVNLAFRERRAFVEKLKIGFARIHSGQCGMRLDAGSPVFEHYSNKPEPRRRQATSNVRRRRGYA